MHLSIEDFKPLIPDTNFKEPIWYSGYDNYSQNAGYFKQGALKVEKGQHLILDYTATMDTALLFSAWVKVDHRRYGVGNFEYRVYNTNSELIFESKPDIRKSGNVHDDWIRAEQSLKLNSKDRLIIHFNTIREQSIDDAMLSIEGENSLVKGEKANLIEGYKILKK